MLKNSFVVTFFLIISSFLGFFSQVVNVNSFGATKEMDFYFQLIATPSIITGIAPMVFSFVYLPYLAKELSISNEPNRFIFRILNSIIFFSLIFIIIGLLGTIVYYRSLKSQEELNSIHFVEISILIWISSGLSIISGFLSAILNYKGKFISVAWTSLLIPAFSIFFVILLNRYIGVLCLSLSAFFAICIQFLVFINKLFPTENDRYFTFKEMSFDKSLIKKIFFVFISLLPFTIIAPISYYLASSLSIGSVSYIGFSQSFSGFISVAAGMGISIVSFPNLVNELTNGNIKEAKRNMEFALKFILIISMLVVVGFLSLKIPLLSLLYCKAGASKLNIVQLSKIIPLYLISSVFIAGLNQVRTLYYAEGKYKQLAILSVFTLIIFSILSWFFRDLLGFLGIGIANLISMLLFFILSIYYLEDRDKNTIFSFKFFLFFIKIITLLSVSGFITYQLNHIISYWIVPILAIFVSGFIYLIVTFLFANKVIKVEELIMVEKTICKLIFKNRQ